MKNKFAVSERLKLPIVWTLFFALIGMIQQSLISGHVVFLGFFTDGYLGWFYLFASFTKIYNQSGMQEITIEFLRTWYYFFFTGGLIAIISVILYILTEQ